MIPILDISDMTCARAGVSVLQNITFRVEGGQAVALMGVNGVGKSTLLKCILGLIPEWAGEIQIRNGGNMYSAGNSKARQSVCYLPEKFDVHSALKGADYIKSIDVNRDRAAAIGRLLALPCAVLEQRIGTYSKGMLQKLGLVCYFASDARLKIADEVMSGLDFETRDTVRALINQQKEAGTAFLFTSHLKEDAVGCADQLLYLEQRRIAFEGPPHTWSPPQKSVDIAY